ncbi:MAG: hypothetical protein JSU95_03865 [Betaproteobacteria bacterium]|nr:MAG: hypothetical protein JSU95_03865 [Betaproteobacteria bacterium]
MTEQPTAIEKAGTRPLAAADQPRSIEAVLDAALQAGRSAEELKQLHELYKLMKADQAEAEYNAAFLAFQSECEPLPRTGRSNEVTGPGTQIRFTWCTLADLDTALPLLAEHGFTRIFGDLDIEDGWARMECTLTHTGGHSETKKAKMPLSSNFLKNPQNQVMAAASYLRRLLFGNMLGVPVSDLDNQAPAEDDTTLTDEQQQRLNDLLIELKDLGDTQARDAMLKYTERESVGQIPARLFKVCEDGLIKKIAKQRKG